MTKGGPEYHEEEYKDRGKRLYIYICIYNLVYIYIYIYIYIYVYVYTYVYVYVYMYVVYPTFRKKDHTPEIRKSVMTCLNVVGRCR